MASCRQSDIFSFERLAIAAERQGAIDGMIILVLNDDFEVEVLAAIALAWREHFGHDDIVNRRSLDGQHRINFDAGGGCCGQQPFDLALGFPTIGKEVNVVRYFRQRQNR